MHTNEASLTTSKTLTPNSPEPLRQSCAEGKQPHGIQTRLTIYPNGDCVKHNRHGLGKFLPNGPEELRKMECARIRVGDTEVVIHADEVNFDRASIMLVIERLHQEIKRLRGEVRSLKGGGGAI